MKLREAIEQACRPLVGLRLASATLAANMRCFQFGDLRYVEGVLGGLGLVGEYGLHLRCAWRLEARGRVVTGRADLYEPATVTEDFDWQAWDHRKGDHLQDARLEALFGGRDGRTGILRNTGPDLVVEEVRAYAGGVTRFHMSGPFILTLFPDGSAGEQWRLLKQDDECPHFVVDFDERRRFDTSD